MVVPVTSAAMAVSSSSSTSRERVLLPAFAGYLDLGIFRGISDLGRDFLLASVDFGSPTGTKSDSRKLALENDFVDFSSRELENSTPGGDLL